MLSRRILLTIIPCTVGFIIMDGNGALFGTLSGNTRDVIHKFSVDLPKKHGRGGQSALRFARLREEKRHNYVRKVAELAVQNYITQDKVNVAGLVLAGSADFKNDLNQSGTCLSAHMSAQPCAVVFRNLFLGRKSLIVRPTTRYV